MGVEKSSKRLNRLDPKRGCSVLTVQITKKMENLQNISLLFFEGLDGKNSKVSIKGTESAILSDLLCKEGIAVLWYP